MWRRLLICFGLLFTIGWVSAQQQQSVDALLDIVASAKPIPYADRQAAKQELIARPYDEVLPKLAPRISNAPSEWSTRIRGSSSGIGIGDEHTSPGEQAIWALNQIWNAQTYGDRPDTFPHDLVRYLNDAAFHGLRDRIVDNISIYWCAEAELPVTAIFHDVHESTYLRWRAAYVLMRHARDKNIDALLDFAQANPSQGSSELIRDLMTAMYPRYSDRPADARLLVIAHDLMEREVVETGHLSGGYPTALAMGDFIASRNAPPDRSKLVNPFAPQQNASENQNGNLTENFFETPVIKARAWWANNGERVRAASTQPSK